MKIIDLKKNAPRNISVMTYGASRVGKTRFASTFPRPVFLSDVTEKGWETIRNMDAENFFESDYRPEVWGLENPQDMYQAISNISTTCKTKPGHIQTVVIDSLTFYSDLYFTGLETGQAQKNNAVDRRRLYGDLEAHLRWVMTEMHKLPVNVVWVCLEKSPGEGGYGGPLLTGQTRDKAPARCEYLLYQRAYRAKADEPPIYEIRTQTFGGYVAGGRQGDVKIPDPMEPTYRALARAVGIPLPGEGQQKKAAAGGRR